MKIKCIALGNTTMSDDGIGIIVLKAIMPLLEKEDVTCIFGETDSYCAYENIEDGDFLFIIDATFYNMEPGTLTVTGIQECLSKVDNPGVQHGQSLLHLLKIYEKPVRGYVIGIEAGQIDFGLGPSELLNNKFQKICEEVYNHIKNLKYKYP